MADISFNATHKHTGNEVRDDGGTEDMPYSYGGWQTCGLSHTTCKLDSIADDAFMKWNGESSFDTGYSSDEGSDQQTGDIAINRSHDHSAYINRSNTTGQTLGLWWNNCPTAHSLCDRSTAETQDTCWKTSTTSTSNTGNSQDTGDVTVNWSHSHQYYYWGYQTNKYKDPVTCPSSHALCQVSSTLHNAIRSTSGLRASSEVGFL